MRNKNNPLGSMRADLPGFRRSEFQRGNKVSMTMALGGYYPVENYEILSGSRVELKLSTKLESFPALSPLYNSVRLRYDVFFCPYRLYIPNLFNNNNNDDDNDILSIHFPRLKYPYQGGFQTNMLAPYKTELGDTLIEQPQVLEQVKVPFLSVPYGSVLDYLNYPQFTASYVQPDTNIDSFSSRNYFDFNVKNRDEEFKNLGYDYLNTLFRVNDDVLTTQFEFNLIPWLAYIDTYSRYIANPQDEIIPFRFSYLNPISDESFGFVNNTLFYLDFLKIQDLQNIISLFRDTNDRHSDFTHADYGIGYEDGHYYYSLYSSVISGQRAWNPFSLMLSDYSWSEFNDVTPSRNDIFNLFKYSYNQVSHIGILPSTYLPDYFNSGLSLEKYQNTRISLNQANYVDQLRIKERQWAIATRFVFGNGSYTDWNYTQYMSNLKLNDYPIHLGSDTINFNFQDILSQTNSSGSEITDFVGGTAGKASFDTRYFDDKFKTIKFTAREPGLLLITARLVPEVDYTSGVPKHLMKQFMSDIFLPENDAVGFEDLMAGELDYGVVNPYSTIWKVPFGWEYMKSYNKSHGLFRTNGFSSWTFQRYDTRNYLSVSDYHKIVPEFTTYILPEQFGKNFADVNSVDNDHYALKIGVDLQVFQPMSKSIINFSD